MKTTPLASNELDDVVFENRNKEYGAYALRKGYSGNIVTSSVSGMVIVISVLILPHVISRWISNDPILVIPGPPVFDLHNKYTIEVIPKPKANKVVKSSTGLSAPVVTNQNIEEPITKPLDPPATEGDANAPVEDLNIATGSGTGITAPSAGEPAISDGKPFTIVEEMPVYKGGVKAMIEFISNNIKYPFRARQLDIEGIVYVKFVVNETGIVTNVEIDRGIYKDCDKEAARVIALMPKWKPGMQHKTPVSVSMMLPIKFQMN